MKRIFLALSLLSVFSIFFIEGCIPSKPVQEERQISPDRLIKRLEASRRKIKTMEGAGSITINTTDINAKSSFKVEIKRPDSIKVSFYGPFGIDLASALITQQNFQFYDAINNNYYKGKLSSDAMKQVMKIEISFGELMDVLTGSVNLTDKLRRDPQAYESTDEFYRLTYNDSTASKSSTYIVRQSDLGITEYFVNTFAGKKLINAKYSDFHEMEDAPIPYLIDLNELVNNQKIKIEYRTVDVNKEIGNLSIDIPNDAKVIDW